MTKNFIVVNLSLSLQNSELASSPHLVQQAPKIAEMKAQLKYFPVFSQPRKKVSGNVIFSSGRANSLDHVLLFVTATFVDFFSVLEHFKQKRPQMLTHCSPLNKQDV